MAFAAQAKISTASNAGRRTLPMTTPIFSRDLLRSYVDLYPAPKIPNIILPQSGRVDHFFAIATRKQGVMSALVISGHTAVCGACPLSRAGIAQ